MQKVVTVDEYLCRLENWREEVSELRTLLLESELEETIKWGMPTYTLKGKNVVGLSAFKNYYGLWFHQGIFLNDSAGMLINAQDGKTKGMRQLRLQSPDIDKCLVIEYIKEAIANEKAGKRVQIERCTEVLIPPELAAAMLNQQELKKCFNNLTPRKQKEYAEFIASAKREQTKTNRLNKIIPMIKSGKGLNDDYR